MDRPEHRNREEALEALRAELEELRGEPMGEEEIMEMLREVPREAPPARLPLRTAFAAGLVAAAAALVLFTLAGGGPAGFAVGPQVAGIDDVEVRPPPLRVPRSESWDEERYRMVIEVREDETVTRLSYEPADGGARIRRTPARIDPPIPAPKGAPEDALVAVLVVADGDTPWRAVRPVVSSGPPHVLYLAGTEEGGTLGAVAARVPSTPGMKIALREIARLGAVVTPRDLMGGFPENRVLELRVTRGEDGTRYRFGLHPYSVPGADRFGLGDETVTEEELGGGSGPLLPDLAAWFAGSGSRPERGLAFLEAGTGVRYLDVLRALESMHGGWLLDCTAMHPIDPTELPRPASAADAGAMTEEVSAPRILVNVSESGEIRVKGRRYAPEEVDLGESGREVWLRADRRAPFPVCGKVIERAEAAGRTVRLVFARADPEIPWERTVALPAGGDIRATVRIELGIAGAPASPKPRPTTEIVLLVPEGATVGEVLPDALHWIRLGAGAIRFE